MTSSKGADSYVISMECESKAREAEIAGNLEVAVSLWRKYAQIKLSKGSYFLASYGRYQEGRLLEKEGRAIEAAKKHAEAAEIAKLRCKSLELTAFLLLESAKCWALANRQIDAHKTYEALANMWGEVGDRFKAGDAYERAADALKRAGIVLRSYEEPGKAWVKCSEVHLERGDIADALWSLERQGTILRKLGRRSL